MSRLRRLGSGVTLVSFIFFKYFVSEVNELMLDFGGSVRCSDQEFSEVMLTDSRY